MSKKNIEMEHPMAGKSRISKAQKIAEDSSQIFNKIEEEKVQEKVEKPVSDTKIRSLKELLSLGSTTKTVEIAGFIFKLKSLTHQENRDIAKRIFLMSDEDRLIESNIIQLAYSLDSINGISIEETYSQLFDEPEENLTKIEMAIRLISQLNNHLVGKLLEEFFDLSNQSKKLLNLDEDQNLVKK